MRIKTQTGEQLKDSLMMVSSMMNRGLDRATAAMTAEAERIMRHKGGRNPPIKGSSLFLVGSG
jgi:hypothetical protein